MNSKQLAILLDNQLMILNRINNQLFDELKERGCLYQEISNLMIDFKEYIDMTATHAAMLKESTFVVQKREDK